MTGRFMRGGVLHRHASGPVVRSRPPSFPVLRCMHYRPPRMIRLPEGAAATGNDQKANDDAPPYLAQPGR